MIFSLFNWIFTNKTEEDDKSGSVAKQRLQLLLVHDRVQLPPHQMEALKRDLLEVVKRYVELGGSDLEVNLEQLPDSRNMALVSNIPVKRVLDANDDEIEISAPF